MQLGEAVAEVVGAAYCRHPVRLWSDAVDTSTGELTGRSVLVACKDRRQILCPACAERYQQDAFQIVAAGLRGGKGVPVTVADHPACFVTLTAPSFGPVHSRPSGEKGGPCRPRRKPAPCPHGVEFSCTACHRVTDPVLGRPICAECFDYEGAVLWNAQVSLLWRRTSVAISRAVATTGGIAVRDLRAVFRCSYVKVVEFQRRGLIHLHVVVRADGPEGPGDPPPEGLTAALLARAIEEAVARVEVPGFDVGRGELSAPARWGKERAVRAVSGSDREVVAAYLAKYALKAATTDPVLARRLDPRRPPFLAGADPHAGALVASAWRLGGRRALEPFRLRAHAHTFGYGGHFATKSRLWSTTFTALRQARAAYRREAETEDGRPDLVEAGWHYAGRGYRAKGADRLAEVLGEAIATRPRRVPGGPQVSPGVPGDVPRALDQGR